MSPRPRPAPVASLVPTVARDDVVVVVPTYQEAENVVEVVAGVRAVGMRVLVVDDGSPDGTGEIVDDLADADDGVSVLHRLRPLGLGPAYAAGFARAAALGADIVCEMDADLSHDPGDLPRLVAAVDAGADLAIGSRYVPGGATEGWPWHRRALSRGGNLYARTLLRLPVRDVTAGFRAYRLASLRRLHPETCEASGYGFQIELTLRAVRAHMEVVEVPIVFRERLRGRSKMSAAIAAEAVRLVARWARRGVQVADGSPGGRLRSR